MEKRVNARGAVNSKPVALESKIFIEVAVAEWSEALLEEENINENQKISGLPSGMGNLRKSQICFEQMTSQM